MVQIAVRDVFLSASLSERSRFSKHSTYFGKVSVDFFSSRCGPRIVLGSSLAHPRMLNRLVLTQIIGSLLGVTVCSCERIWLLMVLHMVIIMVLNTIGGGCASRMQTSVASRDCHRIRKLDVIHECLNVRHVNLGWASRFGHNLGVIKIAHWRISYPLSVLVCWSTSAQCHVLFGLSWVRSVRICDSLVHGVTNVLHGSARSQPSNQSEIACRFTSFNRNGTFLTHWGVTSLGNNSRRLGLMLRIKRTWHLIGLSGGVVGSPVGCRSLHQFGNDTLFRSHEVVSFQHRRQHIVRRHISRRASIGNPLVLFNGARTCCVCLRRRSTSWFLSMNYVHACVMCRRVLIWRQLMNEAVRGALRRFRGRSLVVCGERLHHKAILSIATKWPFLVRLSLHLNWVELFL